MKSLKAQEKELREAAKRRGLVVRKCDSLRKTPYRAMNPHAARELGVPCPKRTITYTLSCRRPAHRKVLDIRHELIEYDEMKKGKHYRPAHRIANRRQQRADAI